MRIGFVDYINALPFTLFFRNTPPRGYDITYGVPSLLNKLLRDEELDCSLVSVAECLDYGHIQLPSFGTVARGKVRSVNLYTKKPVTSLSGEQIGITEQSATSVSLLRTLCRHVWNVAPHFEPIDRTRLDSYTAFLLIGDEALQKERIQGYETVDLPESWYQATGLPFVFAVFTAGQKAYSAKRGEVDAFMEFVKKGLDYGKRHQEEVYEAAIEKSNLSRKTVVEYFDLIHCELDSQALQGLELFKKWRADV